MADASRDSNFVPTLIGVSSVDLSTPVTVAVNPITHRVLTDASGGGSGTVTSVSVASANGFSGTVATPTTTPAITVQTTINAPALAGNGTALSAATTTGTGATVVLQTSPTLVTPNLGTPTTLVGTNITGTASGLTAGNVTTNANLTGDVTSVGNATTYNNVVGPAKGGTGVANNASATVTSSGNFGYTRILTGTTSVQFPTSGTLGTLAGAETLTNKTINSATLATPIITGSAQLAENASIALDPAGSADGKYTGITVTATSGYTQAFGDLVYLDPTDSRWEATDANSAAGADGDARGILGMVVSAGTDGNPCTILLNGIIRADAKFPTFTVNNPIYVSETAGLVTQTQPTTTDVVIRIVGFALTADEMYFNPDNTYITHT